MTHARGPDAVESEVVILAPPPRTAALRTVVLILASATAVVAWIAAHAATSRLTSPTRLTVELVSLAAVLCCLGWPLGRAAAHARASHRSMSFDDVVEARRCSALARHHALQAAGFAGFILVLAAVTLLLCAEDFAVQRTFFDWDLIQLSFPDILKAFGINVLIACCAQALAMVFGLVLAVVRSLDEPGFAPLRTLAIAYIDAFRSLPAIVVIYLVCLGVPLAGIPYLSGASPIVYAIVALSLTFAAYNAELFRSGMDSIHHSQISAAYSLGLTPADVFRRVVLPQVVRRLAPAMLGAFVMLQKDTALVNIVGIIDAFAQSKIYSGNHYNLSSIVVVCVLFIVCTIPQTRFVDYQLAKAKQREAGS